MDSQEKCIIRPLPKRVLVIRKDECAPPMNLYMRKYISADNETNLAKDLLIHNMYEPVTVMITRAVFYAYMGLRSIFSFVVFFRSLYCNLTTAIGRAALKTWFLEAIQQREYLHYSSLIIDKKRQDSFMALINGILNDRLVDKADCVTYLSSPTLEALNIIPCAVRFDRRCERLNMAPLNQQNKISISKSYNTTLANKLIHHYILNTMEIDNEKYGYAIIPLTDIDKYNNLFRSYLAGDDKLDANVIIDIMLDLFIDEIQHNYSFWMEMVKRCMDMEMSRLPNAADDKSARSSSHVSADKETPDQTKTSTLADLFALKLKDASTTNTMVPCAVYYTLALLIKDDLLDLGTLLYHHHCQQNNTWITPLLMAMFSIGDHSRALWVVQKTNVEMSGSLCDWLQRMIVARITTCLTEDTTVKSSKEATAPTTTATTTTRKSAVKRNNTRRHSPLVQVSLPHDEYYTGSDTDDEFDSHDDYDDRQVDHCAISPARTEGSFDSSTTAVNTAADDNSIYQFDDEVDHNDSNKVFDYFSTQFFYQQPTTSLTTLQLLTDFIVPCMVSIGGTQMAASPNTMNNIIILMHQTLRQYHRPQERTCVAQLFTTFIFPVLSFTVLEDLYECLHLLTTDERLDVYLRWLDDDSDDTLRALREQTKGDVEDLLESASTVSATSLHGNANSFNSLTQHHPIDVAQVILDRIETITTDDDNGHVTAVMAMAADLVCDNQLARDSLFALMAHRLITFDRTSKQTIENPSSLPNPFASLCRFSRYLLNDRKVPCTALFPYLTNSSLMKSEVLTSLLIGPVCGLNSSPSQRPLTKKRSSSVLGTSRLTNKKFFHFS